MRRLNRRWGAICGIRRGAVSEIICYMPLYSPTTEAVPPVRPYTRETNEAISKRLRRQSRVKPAVYFDCIDSVLNNPTSVRLVVADGRSTESMRAEMVKHHAHGGYELTLYENRESQWKIFNDVYALATPETWYMIYSSSDIVWVHDWVQEAISAFEKNPKLQILFPCVNRGDPNLPCQISNGTRDLPPFEPPFQRAARSPVLNMYAAIFRMDFLKTFGGYPNVYKNCFSESYLYYMCEAMGGKMMVLPRGYVYHHSALDAHGDYNYSAEKPMFNPMMDKLLAARAKGEMDVEFLKKLLYV